VAGFVSFAAATCLAVSAVSTWWSVYSNPSGSPVTIDFQPGGSVSGTSNGVTETMSYASQGLGPIGALYEGVLALLLALAALAVVAGVIALLAALGRIPDRSSHRTIQWMFLLNVVVAGAALVLVPALQPTLWGRANPGRVCQQFTSHQTICNSFWGAGTSASAALSWGADVGWYLACGALFLLVGAAVLWASARKGAWPRRDRPRRARFGATGSPTPAAAGASQPERLVQLAELLDSGRISPAEFEQGKTRIFASSAPSGGAFAGRSPNANLSGLESMHTRGLLTDPEYESLRQQVLANL
jgi:putative oligomerization/nucleic acid binding protein